jgi:hypothetical protein
LPSAGPARIPREFSVLRRRDHASIGRVVFGIGAIVTWLATIAFAVVGARKLVRRGKG